MRQKTDSVVQVLAKAGALLDALAEDGSASAGELAEKLGEPRSSIYRLLTTLAALDMVESGPTRARYQLGLHLLRLGNAVVARFDERQAALPVMEELHGETEETVFLCIRRGSEAVCIERVEGVWVRSMALRVGTSLPLHVGAAPRTLLAFAGPKAWNEYFAEWEPHALTARSPVTEDAVRAALQRAVEVGYAVSDEDVVPGMAAVGAPVYDYQGKLRAALSLSGPRPKILGETAERSFAGTVAAAREISRRLGFTGG